CPFAYFVSSCSRALHDLHSFPTRRSSDLEWSESGGSGLLLPRGFPVARGYDRDSQVLLVPKPQRFRIFGSEEESSDSGHFFHFRDRKSTRLNSSHGSISYAVFCLKKKKQI